MIPTEVTDSLLFVITLVCSGGYVYFLSKKRVLSNSGRAMAFLMGFLVLYGLLNMGAHLIAVALVAISKAKAGVFEYDLRFYTLLQFGVLLVLINAYLLRGVNRFCLTNQHSFANMTKACMLQIGIALPLIPFNPLSSVPVLTSIFLILLLRTATRKGTFALKTQTQEMVQELAVH